MNRLLALEPVTEWNAEAAENAEKNFFEFIKKVLVSLRVLCGLCVRSLFVRRS
jgi:hypothetical protein